MLLIRNGYLSSASVAEHVAGRRAAQLPSKGGCFEQIVLHWHFAASKVAGLVFAAAYLHEEHNTATPCVLRPLGGELLCTT